MPGSFDLTSIELHANPSVVPGLRAFCRLNLHTVPVQKYWDPRSQALKIQSCNSTSFLNPKW